MIGASFNRLTAAEAERLALLAEECAEAVQAVTKILRHGYESTHPAKSNSVTNRQDLARELGDVLAAIDLLTECGDLSMDEIADCQRAKHESLGRWLHHQSAGAPR